MTRIRALVIGGGLVAGAIILAGCTPAGDAVAVEASAPDDSGDPVSDTSEAEARSDTFADPGPESETASSSDKPQPTTERELWTVKAPQSDSWAGRSPSPLASSIVDLPAAPIGPIASAEVIRPVGLRIPSLGIEEALVVDVGVESNGDFEVPPADEVGWYRFGPTPGETGSAVLAAHIASGGIDGVFRHLADLEVGAEFSVLYEDGSERDFRVTAMDQYDKDELPTDEFFRKSGESQLVLITCGGDFNRQIRSYDDNIVAVAVPIE